MPPMPADRAAHGSEASGATDACGPGGGTAGTAAGAPLAVRATKAAVNQQVKRALLDSFDLSTALEMTTFLSADHQEALDAIAEKRPPDFRGR